MGYSKDRFEAFRKHKEELFHMKHGRFANKSASLSNSKESTMVEPGSFFAIDNLFEETNEKITALGALGNRSWTEAEEVKNLHVKLKVHSLSQNQRDTAAFKDKVTYCMKKVSEIEQNLAEIKRLELEDDKKYEHLGISL